MRLWIVFLVIFPLSVFAQNQATQYVNLTVTIDASGGVTLSSFPNTTYTSYDSNTAYIVIPSLSASKTYAELVADGKIDLDVEVQVVPIQIASDTYQLQGSIISQRYNLIGFFSPFYYLPQFYLLQLQGLTSNTYIYSSLKIDDKELKIWNQGQTTIGTTTAISTQTVALLLSPSYQTLNLLESSSGSTAIKTLKIKLSVPSSIVTAYQTTAGSTISGTYFFQIYLTLNPYQVVPSATMTTYLTATQSFLKVLLGQSTQFEATNNTVEQATQLAENQAFLTKEIAEVQAAIDAL